MNMSTDSSAQPSLSDCEQITDPSRVARLLEQVARRHALLTITIPGSAERYTSTLVDVDATGIQLDELVPPEGHARLLAERRLQVTGKLDGIDILFTATLANIDERDGTITCHASLPGRLEYRQRRNDYRAHIPMTQRLRVIVDPGDGGVLEGELHDLSLGGAGILFPVDARVPVAGRLEACAIELPGSGWLYCSIEICHVHSTRLRDQQRIGARFVELSHAQTRLLGQCIIELERESLRRRAAD